MAKLVTAERLLEILFHEESRPSKRWLEEQRKRRAIPFVKLGRLIFYDPDKVMERIEKSHTVRPWSDIR